MVKIFSLFKINFLTAIRYKMNFIISSLSLLVPVLPALLLLLNGNVAVFGFSSSLEYGMYLFLSTAIWGGVEVLWSFVFQMRSQMKEGILDETLMMPLNIFHLILGWTMDGILSTVLQSIPLIILAAVFLIGQYSILYILIIIALLIFTFFASYCFATILIAMMVIWKETDQFVSFIGNIAPFICGVIVPLSYVPMPLNLLGVLFPFTWTLDIIRSLLFNSVPLIPIHYEVMILVLLTLFYYVFGKRLFTYLYNKSRKRGGIVGY